MVNNGELKYFHKWDSKPIMKVKILRLKQWKPDKQYSAREYSSDKNNSSVL